ncbi:hypothetical protein J2I47_11720 [Fibrella sp. HMF5335]|uniref:Transcriptional regulator, AbiEi antitoxin, Type IV TA system n=1 Tax=Fibrella rubiginis TaxID=2817060 RepID=A0A939GIT6_9BACT|nr:hypothetical protein [Fibrella rubiginis]MBO0937217.1 hypothetical protein [Fibrella rubiginis]
MNYHTFHTAFAHQRVVSTGEISKVFPRFDKRRLVEWQQKGYIQRVINQWYSFTDRPMQEAELRWVANRIYQPSYLSLTTALSFHNLIPEGVYAFTSVSTRKTQTYNTALGLFSYRQIKPALYFGYSILRSPWVTGQPGYPVLMADMEKALLDYCYLTPRLVAVADFAALRLNKQLLREHLDLNRLRDYLALFTQAIAYSKPLNGQVDALLTYIQGDD